MTFFKKHTPQLQAVRKTFTRLYKDVPIWSDARLLHPEWLYRPTQIIPECEIISKESHVNETDLEISERLLRAYTIGLNHSDDSSNSAIWAQIKNTYHKKLLVALDQRNPEVLAKELTRMFHRSFVQGMFVRGGINDVSRHEWLSIQTLDTLVSLAEYLALVPIDNPEQGGIGSAFESGLLSLVERIETILQQNIGMPDVGSPWGVDLAGRIAVPRSIRHHYTARRVLDISRNFNFRKLKSPQRLVEIGAGFGGTARCLMNTPALDVDIYTLIDLPHVNVIQGYYLARTLGTKTVVLAGEDDTSSVYPKIRIWPTNYALNKLVDEHIDILINEDSLPEIPKLVSQQYLSLLGNSLKGFFFSINHEADSPVDGEAQTKVPELTKGAPLIRCNRQPSWTRLGYVEEVYTHN